MLYQIAVIIRSLILNNGAYTVWSKDKINKYKKLSSMNKMLELGLNVHTFIPCETVSQMVYAYLEFGRVCTIRTDKENIEQGSELKFYKADNLPIEKVIGIAEEIIDNDCIAIIANGLRYDKYLKYNLVYKIEEDGSFIVEFSRKNVPLRHMYKYPDKLNTVYGNLYDRIMDWTVHKASLEADRVDLRIIKGILLDEYEMCSKNKLFNRYIEMSFYSEQVGPLKQNKVYWEV